MNLETAIQTLQEKMGSITYPIFVPSYKRVKQFKFMTTSNFLTVGKQSEYSGDYEYQITLLALIKELCAESIDLHKLTDFDRMRILLSIFYSNNEDISNLIFECSDENCKKNIKYKIDMQQIINGIVNPEDIEKTYNLGDLKIKIIYGAPPYIRLLSFFNNVNMKLKEATTDEEKSTINEDFKTAMPILYIKQLFINDVEISLFEATDENKKKFLELLPPFVYDDLNKILQENTFDVTTEIEDLIFCECGEKMEVQIDLEDFFR